MLHIHASVKASSLGGQGLFADEPVDKGGKVLTFEGSIIDWDEAVERGCQDHVVPVGTDSYVDVAEPEALVNHSCDPSTRFSDDTTLIARRMLQAGDEVTFDYSLVTTDDWTMQCRCGSAHCRTTVGNYTDLPESVREQYREMTPPWMLKLHPLP